MENRFLLACQCGRQLTIDPGQTGQELTCACGAKVQAPATLQELRRLPRAVNEKTVAEPDWGGLQRGIFACGVLLVVAGLIVAGYYGFHLWHVGDRNKPDIAQFSYSVDVDTLTPVEILEIWEKAGNDLPSQRHMPAYLQAREIWAWLIMIVSIGGGMILGGLALCVTASWMAQSKVL